MTEPTYDDERALRAALGTLLADEPAPAWAVADDVARGRALRARRRARRGGGIALVAIVALVVGLVGPLRADDRSTPAPLGSASPSPTLASPPVAVDNYLAALGWPVTSTHVVVRVEDGAVTSAAYAVHSAMNPDITATVTVIALDAATSSSARPGGVQAECGHACDHLISTLVGCTPVPTCSTDTYGVVGRGAPHLLAGSRVVLRTYMDGTELDGVATPAQCTRCDGASLGTASILSVQQLMSVLDLTGKPALRTQPAPSQSTFIADPSPNPYFTAHSVDPVWVTDSLDALTTFTTGQGADVVGEDRRTGRLDIQRGDERAWLQLTYGTTAPDAPACLGLPNCTVVRPWAPASDGSVEVAVTETTVPPNTISMALRGPSYQVLVKRGTNLLRVDEGTTFPTLLNGQRQGYVLSWRQVASAAELLEVSGATPLPPASPS